MEMWADLIQFGRQSAPVRLLLSIQKDENFAAAKVRFMEVWGSNNEDVNKLASLGQFSYLDGSSNPDFDMESDEDQDDLDSELEL